MLKNIFLIVLLITSIASIAQSEWELKKDANAIKIYTRRIPNQSIDEYKAITIIDTKINNVVAELLSAPKYNKANESGVSYYVKQLSENQHVFYAHKPLPWPIRDRDIITLLTVEKISDSKYKLALESLPNAIPEKEKTIRIKNITGHWLLEEDGNKTKVTQQLFVNPEGTLPAFVINSLLIKGPFKTFSELRESLKVSGV